MTAGEDDLLVAGLSGDRGRAGLVLAGSGVGVAGLVVTELGEYPGAEDLPQAGLAQVDLNVRLPAKCAPTCSSISLICALKVIRIATWARTVTAYAAATTGGWPSCGARSTSCLDRVLATLRESGYPVLEEDVLRIHPYCYAHLNVHGRYSFQPLQLAEGIGRRPLRDPGNPDPDEE